MAKRTTGMGPLTTKTALRGGARYKRRLFISFGLVAVFFPIELLGGVLTNSLALLSDAGHMFTDVLGLGMAAAAIHVSDCKDRRPQQSFSMYRFEILAALANAVLLFAVALYILYEAIGRLQSPPEVLSVPMLLVAAIGLAVNVIIFFLLRQGASESLNIEGAFLEVIADALGSIGVIGAAVVLQLTGLRWVDPIVGLGIGFLVLPRTWKLGRKAVRILMQEAPPEIGLEALRGALRGIDGVHEVHDLHVWTLTSGTEVCSVHLRLREGALHHTVLARAYRVLERDFGIDHCTVQVEPTSFSHGSPKGDEHA